MSTLIFCESFDHLKGSQMNRKWTFATNCTDGVIVTGRNGNGIAGGSLPGGAQPSITFRQGPQQTITIGCAWKPSTAAQAFPIGIGNPLSGIYASLTNTGDGRILPVVFGGSSGFWSSGGMTGVPSSWVQQAGIWYYIEVQAAVTPGLDGSGHTTAAIALTVKVNGVQILSGTLNATWPNTITPSWTYWSNMQLFSNTSSGIVDDLYITDTEFLGDISVSVLRPNADGASSQWTPLSGVNHYAMVNDATPDDDTSYLLDAGTVLNDVDYWNLTDIAGSPQILGVQASWCIKNDISGSSQVLGEYRNGAGTVHDAAANYASSATTYNCYLDSARKSLFTAIDWTVAELNAMQLGIKRVA